MEIPEFKEILEEIRELKKMIDRPAEKEIPEWLNDMECWKLKGGCALTTYRTKRFYQCKGGVPDAYIGGRKCWNRKSVEEWLGVTDDGLEEYHRKYKTGAKR